MTFRLFGVPEVSPFGWFRKVLASLLLVQLILAMLVHVADFEYAASYRDFAENVRKEYGELWYVGHWGWKFYAERAGFQLLHRDGPYPESGDFLVWPQKVHIGRVFQNERGLPDRLELVSSQSYEGVIPIRTMDGNEGAGFYSVGRGKLPFRFLPRGPLEVMRIYRVKESKN
jgi:hypothetical protein